MANNIHNSLRAIDKSVCNVNISKSDSAFQIGPYFVTKTLGKGNFSIVKLAIHLPTQMKVAVKIINKTKLNKETMANTYREVSILKHMQHPFIAKLYQVIENKFWLFIFMEYLPNGEFFDYLTRMGRLPENEARLKFRQILLAVEYCHRRNIVHRDLKTENILLDEYFNIKLVDFGFGSFYEKSSFLLTWCGSIPYAAPELFKGEPYIGPKADIWSLGVILYAMVCGKLPFDERNNVSKLREQVLSGWIRFPYFLSYECENLIRMILNRTPSKRPTIPEIFQHEWIQLTGDELISNLLTHNKMRAPKISTNYNKGPRNNTLSGDSGFEEQLKDLSLQNPDVLAHDILNNAEKTEWNEKVLQVMENYYGYCYQDIIEELSNQVYGHLTATYLLLSERLNGPHKSPLSSTSSPTSLAYHRNVSISPTSFYDNTPSINADDDGDTDLEGDYVDINSLVPAPASSTTSLIHDDENDNDAEERDDKIDNDDDDCSTDRNGADDTITNDLSNSRYDNFPNELQNLHIFNTSSYSPPCYRTYKFMKPSATMDTVPRYSPEPQLPLPITTSPEYIQSYTSYRRPNLPISNNYISTNCLPASQNSQLFFQSPPRQINFHDQPTNYRPNKSNTLDKRNQSMWSKPLQYQHVMTTQPLVMATRHVHYNMNIPHIYWTNNPNTVQLTRQRTKSIATPLMVPTEANYSSSIQCSLDNVIQPISNHHRELHPINANIQHNPSRMPKISTLERRPHQQPINYLINHQMITNRSAVNDSYGNTIMTLHNPVLSMDINKLTYIQPIENGMEINNCHRQNNN